MEARAVLSHVVFTQAIVAPSLITSVGLHQNPGPTAPSGLAALQSVVVNGQVELQPGD
jgi:hypothetical protein